MAVLTAKKTGKASEAATWTPEEAPGAASELVVPTGIEVKFEATLSVASLKTEGAAKLSLIKQLTVTGAGAALDLSIETVLSVTTAAGKFSFAPGSGTIEPKTRGKDLVVLALTGTAAPSGSKFKLVEALTASTEIIFKGGVWKTEGFEVVTGQIITEGVTAREVFLGASTIKLTGKTGGWFVSSTTITAEGSTIQLTGTTGAEATNVNFKGEGAIYNVVTITAEKVKIQGSATFATLNLNSSGVGVHTVIFAAGGVYTVTTLAKSAGALTLESETAATPFKFKKASGTVTLESVSLKDSTAEGGAEFKDVNGTNVSGNTGWTFETSSTGSVPLMVV